MRLLVVAQAPSARSDPGEPLSGASGRRLAALMGVPHEAFLAGSERANLLDAFPGKAGKGDRFPMSAARLASYGLVGAFAGRRVILVGSGTATVFLGPRWPLLAWFNGFSARVAVVPHPSGVNRWWNDPANEEAARRFLRGCRRYLAPGKADASSAL